MLGQEALEQANKWDWKACVQTFIYVKDNKSVPMKN